PALRIEGIRLLFKEGGKRGVWLHPDGMDEAERERFKPCAPKGLEGAACAVITLSDRASEGTYEDQSGPTLAVGLQKLGGKVIATEVLPDGVLPLTGRLRALSADGIRLCFCTGGTGLGPRDLTPEALRSLNARPVHGLAQMVRALSAQHTPMAWLSRAEVVQLGNMLVFALPGSPKAAAQCLDILAPVLGHALVMVEGGGHG
ncbi:molybdopterin-binding protein, partial [Stenotrophomonas maltophilia group sp. LNF336]